jgi:hypothetical protein
MNKLEQLKEALNKRLCSEEYPKVSIIVEIHPAEPTTVWVRASKMNGYVPLNFGILKMISEILGTENIDDADRSHTNGCDTCDYGSCYEWTLVCKNCQL